MASIFSNNLNNQTTSGLYGGSLFGNAFNGFGSTGSGFANTGSGGLFGGNYGGSFFNGFGGTFGSWGNWSGWGFGNNGTTTGNTGGTDTGRNAPTTPTGTVLTTVETEEGQGFEFNSTHFEFPDGSAIGGIEIVSLPSNGELELNSSDVDEGVKIDVSELSEFDYTPNDNFDQSDSFLVRLSSNGEDFDSTVYRIEIDIEAKNDAPEIDSTPTLTVTEGGTATNIGSTLIDSVSDPDTGDELSTVTITAIPGAASGTLKYTSDAGGTVTISAANKEISASEAASLYFVAADDAVDNADGDVESKDVTIKYKVKDEDDEQSNEGTITLQINDGDDAPILDAASTHTVMENETLVSDDADDLYPGSDEEDNETLEYSISGLDADLFEVNSINGEISFRNAPDYEDPKDTNKNNEYLLNLTVTDDAGQTATQSMAVTVTNKESDVEVTMGSSVTVEEGATAVGSVTYTNNDAGNDVTFSIAGGADEDLFEIDEETGELSFKSAQDREDPEDSGNDGIYEVHVKVADETVGDTSEDTEEITVTLGDIHDAAPALTSESAADSDKPIKLFESTDFTLTGETGSLSMSVDENEDVSDAANRQLIRLRFDNGEATVGLREDTDLTAELVSSAGTSNFVLETDPAGDSWTSFRIGVVADAEFDYENGAYDDGEATLTLKITDNDDGTTAETVIDLTINPVDEPAEYTEPNPQYMESDDSESVGDEIIGSFDDPEGEELYYVVQAPDEVQFGPSGNLTYYDFGNLFFNPDGISQIDYRVPDDTKIALTQEEAATLEYRGWDHDEVGTNGTEPDWDQQELTINFWAFSDEEAAISFASDTSVSGDQVGSDGSLTLHIVDFEA